MTELVLKDWTDEDKCHTGIDLDNLNDIEYIEIEIISGDEVAEVRFSNGGKIVFDSSNDRMMDFYDGGYTLYNAKLGINKIDDFIKRGTTYSMFELGENE